MLGEVIWGEVIWGEVICGEVICGEVMCCEVMCCEIMCGEITCGEVCVVKFYKVKLCVVKLCVVKLNEVKSYELKMWINGWSEEGEPFTLYPHERNHGYKCQQLRFFIVRVSRWQIQTRLAITGQFCRSPETDLNVDSLWISTIRNFTLSFLYFTCCCCWKRLPSSSPH